MKIAKILWTTGSVLINVIILIYISLMSKAPEDMADSFQYLQDNWGIFSAHWKAELLIMGMITIGAFYFMVHFRSIGWTIVSLGQIIQMSLYPLMLGGYYDTSVEFFKAINEMAIIIFVFGNIVLLGGLVIVYSNKPPIPKWLGKTAMVIAAGMCLVFLGSFLEFYS